MGKGMLNGNAQAIRDRYLFITREDEDGDLYLEKIEITNAQ